MRSGWRFACQSRTSGRVRASPGAQAPSVAPRVPEEIAGATAVAPGGAGAADGGPDSDGMAAARSPTVRASSSDSSFRGMPSAASSRAMSRCPG